MKNDKIIIQGTFDDFKSRKCDGSILLTFAVPPEKVDLVKPLLNDVGESFIILLKKTDVEAEILFEEK